MRDNDPNFRRVEGPYTTEFGLTQTGSRWERVESNVTADDLAHFRDTMLASPPQQNCEAYGWEMPDGRIIQLHPDVKIIDRVSQYDPLSCSSVRLQTVTRPDGAKDYTPVAHKCPSGWYYKKARTQLNPPWYVWPLRPILFWLALLPALIAFSWWTLGVFCGLSYAIKGWEMARRPSWQHYGRFELLREFLLAPIEALFVVVWASLGALPIL